MGVPFSIEWGVPLSDGDWGETLVLDRKIRIGVVADTPEKRAYTLFHELVHCVLGLSGHAERFPAEADEEALVVALENGLFPLLSQIVAVGHLRQEKSK